MKKLARKFRHSEDENLSLPVHDGDSRPLESQEQEELVRSLERSQAQQSRLWRMVFATLFFCYIVFLLYSIFHQALTPWELRYHAYFMEEIYSWMIISADWVAVLACLFAIIGLFHESMLRRRWIKYSWYTGIILAVFWFYYMLRQITGSKYPQKQSMKNRKSVKTNKTSSIKKKVAKVSLGCNLATIWTSWCICSLPLCGSFTN